MLAPRTCSLNKQESHLLDMTHRILTYYPDVKALPIAVHYREEDYSCTRELPILAKQLLEAFAC